MRRLSRAFLVVLFITLISVVKSPKNVAAGVDISVDKRVQTIRTIAVNTALKAHQHLVILGVVRLVWILPHFCYGLVVLGLLLNVSLGPVPWVQPLQWLVTGGAGVGRPVLAR